MLNKFLLDWMAEEAASRRGGACQGELRLQRLGAGPGVLQSRPAAGTSGRGTCVSCLLPGEVGVPWAAAHPARRSVSHRLYYKNAWGKFKEICERPNGSCQVFCLETEVQAGRCLSGQPCCLPMGHQPRIDPTIPPQY
ncbi:beta-defensin 108B [Myotis myotis]|uniref:beta-defensin 108B n=1 Tax=Myotis myotis TaxID=51298 RepID=UPI00174A21FD|nr:beta-defensin 108B [Myotis myotis]